MKMMMMRLMVRIVYDDLGIFTDTPLFWYIFTHTHTHIDRNFVLVDIMEKDDQRGYGLVLFPVNTLNHTLNTKFTRSFFVLVWFGKKMFNLKVCCF
jgi:hypothetical protein